MDEASTPDRRNSKPQRPVGITLLAGVFLWIGCLGSLFFPILLGFGLTRIMWEGMTAGAAESHPWLQPFIHYGAYPFFILYWLLYIAYACIGFGLWKLRNWARRGLLGLLIFFAVASVLFIPFVAQPAEFRFAAAAGLVIVSGWVAWYLNRPRVRFAFGLEPRQSDGSMQQPPGMSTNGKVWTASAAIVTIGLFVGSILFAAESMIRESEIYRTTLGVAERSPCLAIKVGEPFKAGWMVMGNLQESNTRGSAHLEIPISGSKGAGSLVMSAEEKSGVWTIDELALVQKNARLQIIPDGSSASCE